MDLTLYVEGLAISGSTISASQYFKESLASLPGIADVMTEALDQSSEPQFIHLRNVRVLSGSLANLGLARIMIKRVSGWSFGAMRQA